MKARYNAHGELTGFDFKVKNQNGKMIKYTACNVSITGTYKWNLYSYASYKNILENVDKITLLCYIEGLTGCRPYIIFKRELKPC